MEFVIFLFSIKKKDLNNKIGELIQKIKKILYLHECV